MASTYYPVVTHRNITEVSNMMDTGNNSNTAPSLPALVPRSASSAHQHGAPTRRYLNEHITPTLLEGMRLLKENEPAQPLKALGEFFLGRDTITGCQRVGFSRKVVAELVIEATKLLAVSPTKPANPKEWFGNCLLARSAELEE